MSTCPTCDLSLASRRPLSQVFLKKKKNHSEIPPIKKQNLETQTSLKKTRLTGKKTLMRKKTSANYSMKIVNANTSERIKEHK